MEAVAEEELGGTAARHERTGGRADRPMNVRIPKQATNGISFVGSDLQKDENQKRKLKEGVRNL